MSILTIDPGYARCGICVGKVNGDIIKYDLIETLNNTGFQYRLLKVHNQLDISITECGVSTIVYEEPGRLFGRNALLVPQVIGIINLLSAKYNLELVKYSPSKIKLVTTGSGTANKTHVEDKVLKIFGLNRQDFKSRFADAKDDVLDAVAIYYTYLKENNLWNQQNGH